MKVRERTTLGGSAADLTRWLSTIEQLKGCTPTASAPVLLPSSQTCSLWVPQLKCSRRYTDMFEDAGWTGQQLLGVKSDTQLEDLGMYAEVDRKYLLLQLSRVRARERIAQRQPLIGALPPPIIFQPSPKLASTASPMLA